ncbi:alanine--glyoxylate aminotransferase 2, mitochondrial-like [Amphiura filiformis]|uniref:alanine--glyoxylate aminotransferase 2, mitochondrial-like n=1 Tax=Amphiura filiformis TaxID=82378 RepID=UPI003B20CB3A
MAGRLLNAARLFSSAGSTRQAFCLQHKVPAVQVVPCQPRSTVSKQKEDSTDLGMPPCDFIPEEYKGISYDRAKEVRGDKLNPGLLTYYRKPIMVHQGHMQWLYDTEGKRYLDLFAGIVTVSVGHCHPKVNAALHDQVDRLWHTTSIYMHPKIHEYAEKLLAKLPDNLQCVYFVNSGSEANDMAMQMARLHTGAYDLVSLRNAYHGMSPQTMGLTSLGNWHYQVPRGFGVHNAVNPDPFRGPWGGKNCRDSPVQTIRDCNCAEGQCHANEMYVEQFNDLLRHGTPKKIAGFFVEGIQGVGGAVQLTNGFIKEAYAATRAKGGVCIFDEVQTGFGRLGSHYWGFETHGVVPDIVTMAKGMGNGFPIAAVITSKEIASTMSQALHFNTFGGNPMSCAVGSAVLDVIDEEGLQANCAELGTYFLLELAKIRDEFEVVGDVRGKGLMIGFELVTDKESRTPLAGDQVVDIWEDMKDMGVLVGKGGLYGNALRIKPPMCITRDDVDFSLSVLRKALQNNKEKHG